MSNLYPPGFVELLDATEGPVLDNGAGGRRHPRIIGLEIEAHPGNTVQANALDLPFRDDTFALVLSQAVLEHVTDPQRYVDEVFRVLRPGGVMFIEAAFLQPIHQAPHHYFGVTPFGMRHVCRRFDVIAEEQFGSLVDQWDWIGVERPVASRVQAASSDRPLVGRSRGCCVGAVPVGAAPTSSWPARDVLTGAERSEMRRMFGKLEAAMTPHRRWNTASGVRLIGRKP